MKTKKAKSGLKKTEMFFENPNTGNLVSYARAVQLNLVTKKGIRYGRKNEKTGKLIDSFLVM